MSGGGGRRQADQGKVWGSQTDPGHLLLPQPGAPARPLGPHLLRYQHKQRWERLSLWMVLEDGWCEWGRKQEDRTPAQSKPPTSRQRNGGLERCSRSSLGGAAQLLSGMSRIKTHAAPGPVPSMDT